MSKPTPQDLTAADDAICIALGAVGDCMPAALRDALVRASDFCWLRRVDLIHAERLAATTD